MMNKTLLLRIVSIFIFIIGAIICPRKSVSFDNWINVSKSLTAMGCILIGSLIWDLSKKSNLNSGLINTSVFSTGDSNRHNSKKSNLANLPLIIFGLFWIVVGIHIWSEPILYFRGSNVDFTGINKHVGVGLIAMGLIFIASYFWKSNSKQIHSYKTGEHAVKVNNKNKSFGLVQSLELVLNDKRSFTFFCTTEKVATMLLNDFVVGQEATLKINTEDGKDCDLIGNNAYAHGLIRS